MIVERKHGLINIILEDHDLGTISIVTFKLDPTTASQLYKIARIARRSVSELIRLGINYVMHHEEEFLEWIARNPDTYEPKKVTTVKLYKKQIEYIESLRAKLKMYKSRLMRRICHFTVYLINSGKIQVETRY